MADRTFEKALATSVSEGDSELVNQLRSVWQGFVDNYRTFAAGIECDVEQVRDVLCEAYM